MFIEIKGNKGIYNFWGDYNANEIDKSYFINLDLILEINFNKYTETEIDNNYEPIVVGEKNAIFLRSINEDNCCYYLIFTEKGMGEYNRLKRLIEENIGK